MINEQLNTRRYIVPGFLGLVTQAVIFCRLPLLSVDISCTTIVILITEERGVLDFLKSNFSKMSFAYFLYKLGEALCCSHNQDQIHGHSKHTCNCF